MRLKTLKNKIWTRDLCGAFLFYTILPKPPFLKPSFNRIARFAPVIGIVIGGIQSLVWIALSKLGWQNESIAMIAIVIGIWVSGGLHFDGLIDTSDGMAAGPDKCLEAMKDSRAGASGVQAIIMIILIQLAAITSIKELTALVFPAAAFWGRFSQLIAIGNFKYLHIRQAVSLHKANWKGTFEEIKISIFILFIVVLICLLTPIKFTSYLLIITILGVGILPAILIPILIGRRLGGHTGDSYGASVVWVETMTILIIGLISKVI